MEAHSFAVGVVVAMSCALAVPALRPRWIVGSPRIVLALLAVVSAVAAMALFRLDPPGWEPLWC